MKKLTIVVGAGASCGYRLPTGFDLKAKIARSLDLRYTAGRLAEGCDWEMDEAVRFAARGDGVQYGMYQQAGWRIRDAMPQSISIDNFIDCQQDRHIERLGKLAIANEILRAEQKSLLYIDPRKDRRFFDFVALKEDWIGAFFQLLTQNCHVTKIANRLQEISFVIFNYDRCVEHYLHCALQNYYGISENDAAEILAAATFLHPYGTVGALPWQDGDYKTSFGAKLHANDAAEISKQIQTFTEGTNEDASDICAIRESIRTAWRLLFLGFAYNKQNMKLLQPKSKPDDGIRRFAFGTAYGISSFDAGEIADEIRNMNECAAKDVHLRHDLKCHEIFGEYSRGLSTA